MILLYAGWTAVACMVLAMILNLWRILKGPSLPDRILGLDTMFINTISLLILLGVLRGGTAFFEASLLIALLGFVTTISFSKYLLRGDIIE
ncbi:K+/H+ antiporter subunit F [Thiohalorhabdus methylotrophus]|uniref:K+/H+ antiporter subunit F n=1 Tax=Thiohalorhabdus methylotrophus TaxID=3242694 RepID=A0ABV4TX32_9GAMM